MSPTWRNWGSGRFFESCGLIYEWWEEGAWDLRPYSDQSRVDCKADCEAAFHCMVARGILRDRMKSSADPWGVQSRHLLLWTGFWTPSTERTPDMKDLTWQPGADPGFTGGKMTWECVRINVNAWGEKSSSRLFWMVKSVLKLFWKRNYLSPERQTRTFHFRCHFSSPIFSPVWSWPVSTLSYHTKATNHGGWRLTQGRCV